MRSETSRRVADAPASTTRRRAGGRCARIVAVLALGLAAGGCVTAGGPYASVEPARGGTRVAFESIDGPPPGVFQNLVVNLASEAEARRVAVVSRASPADYRIRGYLAAIVEKGRAHISWVWDVYDADKRRVLRIAGEEPGGRHGANAWAAADDAALRRIAGAGMDRLAAFLAAPAPSPDESAPPAAAGPAVAAAGAQPPGGTFALATVRP